MIVPCHYRIHWHETETSRGGKRNCGEPPAEGCASNSSMGCLAPAAPPVPPMLVFYHQYLHTVKMYQHSLSFLIGTLPQPFLCLTTSGHPLLPAFPNNKLGQHTSAWYIRPVECWIANYQIKIQDSQLNLSLTWTMSIFFFFFSISTSHAIGGTYTKNLFLWNSCISRYFVFIWQPPLHVHYTFHFGKLRLKDKKEKNIQNGIK